MFADHSWNPSKQADSAVTGPTGLPTVVIGVDGSSTSWDAFCWGCGEARRMGGRVVAVFTSPAATASPLPEGGSAIVDDTTDTDDDEQAGHLSEEIRREADGLGLNLSFIHARGNPAVELLRIAKVVGADLIVVGKSAQARHRIGGSVGQRLIRRHAAPVVVVVP
ncbi:MAG: universal stress protein [Streptosporangiaceae bacterium]|nr:universal stress protein [Streptosporangiaceae bacterium]